MRPGRVRAQPAWRITRPFTIDTAEVTHSGTEATRSSRFPLTAQADCPSCNGVAARTALYCASPMDTPLRVERIALCPFCGQPVEPLGPRVSLTLKRANDCLVHWRIHEQCFVDRITPDAAERM